MKATRKNRDGGSNARGILATGHIVFATYDGLATRLLGILSAAKKANCFRIDECGRTSSRLHARKDYVPSTRSDAIGSETQIPRVPCVAAQPCARGGCQRRFRRGMTSSGAMLLHEQASPPSAMHDKEQRIDPGFSL